MSLTAVTTALSLFVSPITDWFKGKQKMKQAQQQNDLDLARAVTVAKIRAAEAGDLAITQWENTALENAGIKDEIMMFVILTPMVMCFFPGGAELVKAGFIAMEESLPEYWEYAFYATIGVSYGVRKLTDFMRFKK